MNVDKFKNLKAYTIVVFLFVCCLFTGCGNKNKLVKGMDGTRSLLSSDFLDTELSSGDFIKEITSKTYTNLRSVGAIQNSQNNTVILANSNEAVLLVECESDQIKNVLAIPKNASMVAMQVCEIIGNGYAVYGFDDDGAKAVVMFVNYVGVVHYKWYSANGLGYISNVTPVCGSKFLSLISSIVMDTNKVIPTLFFNHLRSRMYDSNGTLKDNYYINTNIDLLVMNTLVTEERIFLEGYSDDKVGFYLAELSSYNNVSLKNLDPGARKDIIINKLVNLYDQEIAGIGTYEDYHHGSLTSFPSVVFNINSINNSAFGSFVEDKGQFLDGFDDADGVIACGYRYNMTSIDYIPNPTAAYIAKISTEGPTWARISTNNNITKAKSIGKINHNQFYIVGDTLDGIFFGQLTNNANSSCLFNRTSITISNFFLDESNIYGASIEPLNDSDIIESSTDSFASFDTENFFSKFLCYCYAGNSDGNYFTTTMFGDIHNYDDGALDIIFDEIFIKHWDHVLIGFVMVVGFIFGLVTIYGCIKKGRCKKCTNNLCSNMKSKLSASCCKKLRQKFKNYENLEVSHKMENAKIESVDNESSEGSMIQ